jgi:hypothetical protein
MAKHYKQRFHWQATGIHGNQISDLIAKLPEGVQASQFTVSISTYEVWGTAERTVDPDAVVNAVRPFATSIEHRQNLIGP